MTEDQQEQLARIERKINFIGETLATACAVGLYMVFSYFHQPDRWITPTDQIPLAALFVGYFVLKWSFWRTNKPLTR
jgi:hypothetical protein